MISCWLASTIFQLHVGMIGCRLADVPTCLSSCWQACWNDDVPVIMKAGLLSIWQAGWTAFNQA
jgi:hypothetical protein